MLKLKPIETQYKGYRFRSRLEARWAVFFDALGIRWDYEPEGFDLGAAGWYLPDFWLPEQRYWFECKPVRPDESDIKKYAVLANGSNAQVVIAAGVPGIEQKADYEGNLCWVWPREDVENDDFFVGLQWVHVLNLGFRVGSFSDLGDWFDRMRDKGTPEREKKYPEVNPHHPRILSAYAAARSARFEHGERP